MNLSHRGCPMPSVLGDFVMDSRPGLRLWAFGRLERLVTDQVPDDDDPRGYSVEFEWITLGDLDEMAEDGRWRLFKRCPDGLHAGLEELVEAWEESNR